MRKIFTVLALACTSFAYGQQTSGTEEVLRRVADKVIASSTFKFVNPQNQQKYDSTTGIPSGTIVRAESAYNKWNYPNGVLNIGLMQLANVLNDKKYSDYSQRNAAMIFDNLPFFEVLYNNTPVANRNIAVPRTEYGAVFAMGSLDNTGAMSAALTDINALSKRKDISAYLARSVDYISHKQLRLADGILARHDPRDATVWADDMFMSIPFLARYGKLTGDKRYTDDAIKQVELFTKYLYDPNTGLYWHNYYTDVKMNGVAHWGRCNGWIAMSQVELLKNLPANHPKRAELLKLLLRQIVGFSRYQDNSGLWHQLLDRPDSYLETSATAMFIYTIATAVNEGWINEGYIKVARDAWKALQTKVTADGQLQDVCVGTGVEENVHFYYTRPAALNDTHGLGPFLMAGCEMLKYERKPQPARRMN
jgi:rhamnogalacturonyl hydrolase YesR